MELGEVDLSPDELLDYGTLRAEGAGFVRGCVVGGDGTRVDLDDPHAFDLQPIAGGLRTPFAVREGIAVGPRLARGRYRLLPSERSPFGYSFEGEFAAVAAGGDTELVFMLRDASEASLGLRIADEHRTRAWWSYRLLDGGGRSLSTGQIRIVRRPAPTSRYG